MSDQKCLGCGQQTGGKVCAPCAAAMRDWAQKHAPKEDDA